ncbi:hypothetical protein BCY86_08170 [Pajaroellobacter abortibovis]|uniref:Uncharacterized protein n=1 Tax=Pajaroellobacter abortibovis TaxID=1882918 RepID=A0A1L6MYP4_9BACT|nr:hypothetical protein BCY86_08170 [Pajaroellobacter abortibovis]
MDKIPQLQGCPDAKKHKKSKMGKEGYELTAYLFDEFAGFIFLNFSSSGFAFTSIHFVSTRTQTTI